MKKMLRLGLVPLTALTLAAVVNAPVVRAEETISTGVASTLPEPQTPPENQQQPKTITVDLVSKTEDGTVLETSTQDWRVTPENPYGTLAVFIPGYRLIGNSSFELTYDQVQDGDRVLVEFVYQPDENAQRKTITVEKVGKTEDGTVLDTSTDTFWLFPYGGGDRHIYGATHFSGYRVSHFTRQEVTYDEVEDGDKVVLEAIYKPVDPDKLDEDALTFTIKPIDGNFNPLPLEPKTMVIYPDEIFIPRADTTPVYPGYEFKDSSGVATYELIKDSIARDGSFTYPVIYSPVEQKEGLKNKTITIIEERQDEEGRVIFKKEHVFNLKPHQEEQLPLDQTLDQLIRGSNIASWDAYDDGAVIHFTTRRRPKADKPDSTLDDLKKDQQTPEVKPNPVPTPEPEDKPTPTPVLKDLSADRNKLLLSLDESKLTDEQKGKLAEKIAFAETEKDLADLKAELVTLVKAVEKSTEKPADKPMTGKTEVKAPTPAATAKPAANTPAKSDKVALPATGDGARLGLLAAGFSLLLLGLGLAKARKHN